HAGSATLHARAYEVLGDPQLLARAREAAARAYAATPPNNPVLWNGTAGIAYALLALARVDPAGPWRDLVWNVAAVMLDAVDILRRDPHSLCVGLAGPFCLALDLAHDADAGFPGVEA
ncbi:MAG: hypothetical protein KIT31_35375, partial [Deltaproteobacteria bacterium]|nr:hypothetical protein [Deltaproteobacteria bacterium]